MADMLDYAERRSRHRLRSLPDGTWRHRTHMEYEDDVFVIAMEIRKVDDELTVDLSGTSPQAPAVINATLEALGAYGIHGHSRL